MDKLSSKQREWLKHIEACGAIGGSMKAYAEAHGLDLQSFYLWKGRLKKLGLVAVSKRAHDAAAAAIMPVTLCPTPRPPKAHTRIELTSGIIIEVPQHVNAEALCDLLRHAISVS